MAQINPYIHFNGNAEEAFTFYKSVFKTEWAAPIIRMGDMPAADMSAGEEHHDMGNVEQKMDDLEAALAALKAEFDKLESEEKAEDSGEEAEEAGEEAEEAGEEVVGMGDMGGEEMAAGAEDEIDLEELLAELDALDETDLDETKAKEDILRVTKRLKMEVFIKKVVEENIKGLRVWRI